MGFPYVRPVRSPESRVTLRSVRGYGRHRRSSRQSSPNPPPLRLLPQKNLPHSTLRNPKAEKPGPRPPSLRLTEPERPGSVIRGPEKPRRSPESRAAAEGGANHSAGRRALYRVPARPGCTWRTLTLESGLRMAALAGAWGSLFSLLLPRFHFPHLYFSCVRCGFRWSWWRTVGNKLTCTVTQVKLFFF